MIERLTMSLLLTLLLCVSGCGENTIEQKLKTISGNDYLAYNQDQKDAFVKMSLDRFTTWKFWDRPDLCDFVLDFRVLSALYEASAKKSGDNLLAHTFVVYANDKCIEQGQFEK